MRPGTLVEFRSTQEKRESDMGPVTPKVVKETHQLSPPAGERKEHASGIASSCICARLPVKPVVLNGEAGVIHMAPREI